MLSDGDFRRQLVAISLPIMFQQILTTSLSFLDTLMIGQLGATSIAAVGIANQFHMLLFYCTFGIASGASVFLARYYGAGKHREMEKVMGIGLASALFISVLWFLSALFFPQCVMHIFTRDAEAVRTGCTYLRIVAPSYILYAVTYVHSIGFRSIGKARIPLYASFFALSFNAIGNYLLIFGIGPFPQLGVAGAALSTTFSRLLEFLIVIGLSYLLKTPYRIQAIRAFRWQRAFLQDYVRISMPILLNEALFCVGVTIFKVAYAPLGIEALASINVSEAITNFFFVSSVGISHASSIVIGQRIGAGEADQAYRYGILTIQMAFFASILQGLLIALSAPCLVQLFNISEALRHLTMLTLFVNALYQPANSVGMLYFVGIFRAGGDTRFSFIGEVSCVFFVGIPLAFLATSLGLPISAVIALVKLNEVVKTIVGFVHMRKRKWIRKLDS